MGKLAISELNLCHFLRLPQPTRQMIYCSAADKSAASSPSPAALPAGSAKSGSAAEAEHSAKLADVQSHLKDLYSSDVSTEVQHNYTGTASSSQTVQSTEHSAAGVMQTHAAKETADPFAEAGEAAQAQDIKQD